MNEEQPINEGHFELLKKLRPGKIVLPILIGLGVVVWFIAKDINLKTLHEITFSWRSVFWLAVAVMFIFMRTFCYMARIKVLSDDKLSWLQSFRIIMLWEFTSAITPSTVGGTAFAVIFLHKEGISTGRSTSVVLVTSFLDELYFVVMFPLVVLITGWESIFVTSLQGTGKVFMDNLVFVAIAGYLIILAWVVIVGYGLFFRPEAIKKAIIGIFRLPFLRKWQNSASKAGDDIVLTSGELKEKSYSFWGKSLFYTFVTWTARYLLVNAILLAFFRISDHLLIFSRQLVLWIMMIISPTPGGAGFAEVILGRYLSDLIPVDEIHANGVSLAMAVIWRVISYYPFLIAGVLILPAWIGRKFVRHGTKR
ncbi:MAG TPA: lysylphosphatidylglycerol synthase transmembrane domain-containing protein [Bacteroidales bacterium]|nr:lysylphosphatidylglycerol synthase transmembrane domain-containing protein [Bacteroidales bacterium]